MKKKQNLTWTVGHSESYKQSPKKMVPATVPGNVNLDWAAATQMPDWKFGTNFEEYRWMEECWWLYEAHLPAVSLNTGEKLFFVAEGIDYEYKILLDGKVLLEHEGMFTSIELPIENNGLLQIWIAPVPKDPTVEKDTRAEAAQSCKPAVSYGWDWHPRLIPIGIWQDAYLEIRPEAYFADVAVEYALSKDLSEAEVYLKADIVGSADVQLTLYDSDNTPVMLMNGKSSAVLKAPKLWWCNGYGDPNLYHYEAILTVGGQEVDKKVGKIGFRTVELVMNEGSWDIPLGSPASRNPVPITVQLNGVPIFAKGSNWVNPEIFTGTITRDTYLPLIQYAKEANFNLLRCWGGSNIDKTSFFEICDELGIMVWQEFPLSCCDYYNSPNYLKVLEQEAQAIIKNLKQHPSIVIWCGGNELFNSWSKMTDQSLALRLLNKLCYELDRGRPFLMTSPLEGMGHGNYLFKYHDGREVYQVMPLAKNTAYTEFGVPSISNIEVCLQAADMADLFPLVDTPITHAHHAFRAWDGDYHSWGCLGTIQGYFGEAADLEDLIYTSQWMQGEGYKCIYEEARRQKPLCSMALNWCYNEPWPTIANNTILNYPSIPKKSFYDVKAACRGALISARIPKFMWDKTDEFNVELWLLNDGMKPIAPGRADVWLELGDERHLIYTWDYDGSDANKNLVGPKVNAKIPFAAIPSQGKWKNGTVHEMKLVIDAGELSSTYRLLYCEV